MDTLKPKKRRKEIVRDMTFSTRLSIEEAMEIKRLKKKLGEESISSLIRHALIHLEELVS